MMTINHGGSAFSSLRVGTAKGPYEIDCSGGMTMRNWYAGKAMQSLIISDIKNMSYEHIAILAFKYADAMILQSTQGKEDQEEQPVKN